MGCCRARNNVSEHSPERGTLTRRGFIGASSSAALVSNSLVANEVSAVSTPESIPAQAAVAVSIEVNGKTHALSIDPRTTLLDLLRERLALTGSKKGCDHGQCGACTVLAGKQRVLSCLTLAAAVRQPITTIEGIAGPDGSLHPMQQAFIDHDAFQCGYCTPGQIISAIACVQEGHARSDAEIREYMSGNLCRCAAYPHIVAAIEQARSSMEG
jgi:xanthine dehydrogenase YagT iron-sulfur-binding subunit